MAILKETYNRVSGAMKVIFGSAVAVGLFDALKGIIKEKSIEEGVDFIKSLATGKGLENEAVYGYILDKCNLTTPERSLLIRASKELRSGTEEEKQAANNFIILVALGDPGEKTKKRPGERIIHGFIHRINEYADDNARVQMIKDNIIHIGTDAETKKKIAVVQKWAIGAWNEIKGFMEQVSAVSADFEQKSEKALREFQNRPLWKKIFLN